MAGWDDISAPVADWDAVSAPVGKPKRRKRSAAENVTGFMANVNRGLGIGDELAAGAQTAVNLFSGRTRWEPGDAGSMVSAIGSDFKRNMAGQRKVEDTFAAEAPRAAALARGTGMAATAAVPVGNTANLFAQGSRAVNAARGATMAGLQGAAFAAADRGTAAERLEAASETARNPFVLGLGAASGALATPARTRRPKPPNVESLRAEKNAAYKAVENSGVTFSQDGYNRMADNIVADAEAAKINPMRHPKAASMLEDINNLRGREPTLTELDQLRQVIRRDVASATDDAEAFFGRRMIDQLDAFIDSAQAADLSSGNVGEAAGLVRRARDLNTRVRKISDIEDAAQRGEWRAGSTGSGGNTDNAIRQNMRRLLENSRNWTPEERQVLEQIVMGTRGQNLLRRIGKLSPEGNGLMMALQGAGLASGFATGGTTAGATAALGVTGAVSKRAADAMTQQKVTGLIRMIAEGADTEAAQAQRQLAELIANDPAAAELMRQVAARLSRAAGVAGAAPEPAAPRNLFAEP